MSERTWRLLTSKAASDPGQPYTTVTPPHVVHLSSFTLQSSAMCSVNIDCLCHPLPKMICSKRNRLSTRLPHIQPCSSHGHNTWLWRNRAQQLWCLDSFVLGSTFRISHIAINIIGSLGSCGFSIRLRKFGVERECCQPACLFENSSLDLRYFVVCVCIADCTWFWVTLTDMEEYKNAVHFLFKCWSKTFLISA